MMFDFVDSPLIGLMIRIVALVFIVWAFVMQLKANQAPKDRFTTFRGLITTFLAGIIIFSIPGVIYLYLRTMGIESTELRHIVTITTNIAWLFTGFSVWLGYRLNVKRD